jgi:hypothetical protein
VSHGPARFRQKDLAKALKAVAAAGMAVAEIKVDKDGLRIVVVGEAGKTDANNPLDQWMADHASTS